jgi:hypothetical protein
MAGNDTAFLNTETWKGKLFLGGWTAAGKAQDVLEPATGAVLTNVGMATPADVAQAAQRARAAQPGWAGMPYEQRAAIFPQGRRDRRARNRGHDAVDGARDRLDSAQGRGRTACGGGYPA